MKITPNIGRLLNALENEGALAPSKLDYFYQFNERFYIIRQASSISVDQRIVNYNWRLANKQFTPQKTNKKIEEALDEFHEACKNLDQLQELVTTAFLDFYSCDCFKRNLADIHDHGLLELSLGHLDKAAALADELISAASMPPNSRKYLDKKYSLSIGITYAEALNYSEAIQYLSESIGKDPKNKQAYLERAIAYFETNKMAEAKDDFLQLDTSDLLRVNDTSHTQFSLGFLLGAPAGISEAAIDIPASLWYSLQGVSHLLWTSVSQPLDVPKK